MSSIDKPRTSPEIKYPINVSPAAVVSQPLLYKLIVQSSHLHEHKERLYFRVLITDEFLDTSFLISPTP